MCTLEFHLSVKLMMVGYSQTENTRNKQCLKMYMLDITRNKKMLYFSDRRITTAILGMF